MTTELVVLEAREAGQQDPPCLGLVTRQRQCTSEDIARWQHAELVPQHAGAPPLSNTVTIAFTRSHGLCLRPPIKLGSPVPPPKHPTFNRRNNIGALSRISSASI